MTLYDREDRKNDVVAMMKRELNKEAIVDHLHGLTV